VSQCAINAGRFSYSWHLKSGPGLLEVSIVNSLRPTRTSGQGKLPCTCQPLTDVKAGPHKPQGIVLRLILPAKEVRADFDRAATLMLCDVE